MLQTIDYVIMGAYCFLIITLGVRFAKRRPGGLESYLLAGRRLTLPAFVATLVSTWYGGILGVGEFSYLYGVSNWLVFGVPYYVAAILFALLIASRARRSNVYTIPHQLERAYGKLPSLLAALFVFMLTIPAAYILMLGTLLHYILNWPLWICLLIGTSASTIYVWFGGFASVIRTDKLQFLLMYIGFLLIVIKSAWIFGGWTFLTSHIPQSHLEWHGGQGAGYIWVWFFIALATLIDPSFYQRCFAVRTPETARRGIFISVAFWILFDFLTTTAGLYSRAIFPHLDQPVTAYLNLAAEVLPPVFLGLFYTSLLATIMSTIDSYTFLSAMTLGRDFFERLFSRSSQHTMGLTRFALLLSALLGVAVALWMQSVIDIWKHIGSIITPALLIPLVSSFFPRYRMRSSWVPTTMLTGLALPLFWTFTPFLPFTDGHLLWKLEPIYSGLVATLVLYLVDLLSRRL